VRVILASIFAVVLGVSVFAQSPTGSIGGIVFDADARTIPGAEIIVVNDLTRVQYETKTNDTGIYAVPNLPPGPYRIQASKSGFKTLIKPDIILNVQDAITVNFTLPIGATSIAVTVEGGAPMINTTDASVSTVVDRQFAEKLPMNGRSFQTLIELTPGVVLTATNSNDAGQFSVNGQRATSNYWMVDGVSANIGTSASSVAGNGYGGTLGGFSAFGGTNSLVSVDALEEFRIQTSTYAPEFGRTPGGQISIVTRAGTNEFHGTAFDYLRNDALDAGNWFNGYTNTPPLPKAKERQNDFGGTFNGPIVKNKTFFFFSYEGLRLRLPETTLTNVPDLAARQSAAPAMKPFLDAYPLPNGSDDPSTGIAGFNATYSNPATLDAYSLRVDHRLGEHWIFFGRYNYSPSEFTARGTGSGAGPLNNVQPFRITTQTGTVAATWNVYPTLTNDLRFNYSRVSATSSITMDTFGGAVPLGILPLPNGYSAANSYFQFYLQSLGPGNELQAGKFAGNLQRQINLVDTAAWQKGPHALKVGVDFRRLSPQLASPSYVQEAFFQGVPAAVQGQARTGVIFSQSGASLLFHNLGLFAQDTWRVSPRITVTYGLRWDFDFAPTALHGPSLPAVSGYNLSDFSPLTIAPAGTPPFATTFGNVAPRVGLAYQLLRRPNHATVIRGGFGVFYDLASSQAGNLIYDPPFAARTIFHNATFPFGGKQEAPPTIPATGTLSNLEAFNPGLNLPYTLQWNVSLEQSMGKQQTISASYIGSSGRRLLQSMLIVNPPSNPKLNGTLVDNTGASNYQALQTQFQRRLSAGLQALASYTYSHSIDNASAGSTYNLSNSGIPGSPDVNRGDSDFDIRHAFTLGLTYAFPSPHRPFLKELLSNWSGNTFIVARSAPPVDVEDVHFFFLNNGVEADIRPDVVAGQPYYLYGPSFPGGKALNSASFTDPPMDKNFYPTRQGTLGRNALRGFGATQWDFALHREFILHESVKLQFRAELFNILNHPNFGPPSNFFGESGFGTATQMLAQSLSSGSVGAGGLNPLYQLGGPRSVQAALKFLF